MHLLKLTEVIRWQAGVEKIVVSDEFPSLLSCDHTIKIRWDSEWRLLQKGQMLLLRAGKMVELDIAAAPNSVQLFRVCFQSYALIEDNGDKLTYSLDPTQLPAHGSVADTGTLTYRAVTVLKELAKESMTDGHAVQARQHYLLSELLDLFIQALKPVEEKVDSVIWEALEYMNRHYDRQLTRSQMAKMVGFNTSYFSRLFHKRVGRSFSDHLSRVRVDKAKQYLLTSDATLGAIAAKVGYADGLYLSRKFKQIVGMSPTEYRNLPKPKRIVAMQYTGDLLALGIKPIAAPFTPWEVSPFLIEELEGMLDMEQDETMRRLQTIEVDMIVAPEYLYYWPGKLEQLEQLASVIVLPWNRLDRMEAVRLMGRVVGREDAAEQWIHRYMSRAASIASKLKELIRPGDTVGLYEVREDYTICIWNSTARGSFNLYHGLKLTPHPRIQQEVLALDTHLFIDESLLPEYAADHMFVVLPSGSSDLYHSFPDKLNDRQVWRKLLAQGRRRIYPLKLEEFWCNDAAALEKQLGIMADLLLGGTVVHTK
ncbi:helix-turn-helix domain-containing protein [Paenibacillus sp. IHBB 10380]|uniref:helix-turn-helix domain-containing protein n=1 Tax=Paenibacillus sp. IHBB 10380 TaxID=1566358 RepID=UPI0013648D26|nr:helix-turn-helix domain-containing protein [Paenibacillus sp. IHBB 10380]